MKQSLTQHLAPLQAGVRRHWCGSPAQGLWQAWLSELRDALPTRVRTHLLPTRQESLIDWPLKAGVQGQPAERQVLLLPAGSVLAQALQLPLAALRDLHSVVGFELDKYTPFPRERMHYVARVVGKGTHMAQVQLVAILREHLQPILDSCREQGLTLHAIDCRGADGRPMGIDLLPAGERPAAGKGKRLPRLLALLSTGLLLACMVLWLEARTAQLEAMQTEVDQQREQVQQVQALRRELSNSQGAARYLAGQKAAQPTLAKVLVDLTGCLGADTWVQQLEINDSGGVSISGQSGKASALIGRVKTCSTLTAAQFEGIIQPDEQTGKERFSLRAQLRKESTDAS